MRQLLFFPFISLEEGLLDDMIAKLESKEFMSEYPLMSAMLNSSSGSGESDDGGAQRQQILSIVRGCGFSSYEALLGKC